jgi:acyl carrier protein
MYKDEFIHKLAEIMEVDCQEIDVTTNLKELEEYDSLALIAIIALIDENFAITIPADKLSTVTTVNTLIELIGLEKFK